jgi:hypothetical protein
MRRALAARKLERKSPSLRDDIRFALACARLLARVCRGVPRAQAASGLSSVEGGAWGSACFVDAAHAGGRAEKATAPSLA